MFARLRLPVRTAIQLRAFSEKPASPTWKSFDKPNTVLGKEGFRKPVELPPNSKIKQLEASVWNLDIHWHNGNYSRFPLIWIRDNCQCPDCLHTGTKQRLKHAWEFSPELDTKATSVEATAAGIRVNWRGGHVTELTAEYLHQNSFNSWRQKERGGRREALETLWDSTVLTELPELEYDHYMTGLNQSRQEKQGLRDAVTTLMRYGLLVLRNAPPRKGIVEGVVKQMAPVQETIYGRTWFVESKPNSENLAYTSHAIPLHTDLMYYQGAPGIQFLHCISQSSEGGENYFVDGFKAAQILKEEAPNFYDILSREKTTFHYAHGDHKLVYKRPILNLEKSTYYAAVSWSPPWHGPLTEVHPSNVPAYYEAYCYFGKLLQRPELRLHNKLKPGDLLLFNNRRILHARTEIFMKLGESRLLEGAYASTDDYESAARFYRDQLIWRDVPLPDQKSTPS